AAESFAHFEQTGRSARGYPARVENSQHMRSLITRRQPTQVLDFHPTQHAVERFPPGLEIIPLDIQDSPIAGLHEQWDPISAGRHPYRQLDIERITFLDYH